MLALLRLVLSYLQDSFLSPKELKAENTLLRHQLSVLRRRSPKIVKIHGFDRALIVWLYRLLPRLLRAVVTRQARNSDRVAQSRIPGLVAV